MSRFANSLAAIAAAFVIMASTFGAVITVPPSHASYAIGAPALA